MTTQFLANRRRLFQGLGLAAVGLWVWGAPRLAGLRADPMTFTNIPGSPPFRTLDRAGPISASAALFAGLEAPSPTFTGSLCAALFSDRPGPGIAYFSDANCPNCPTMEAAVQSAVGDMDIPLIRHELPLLGPASIQAARAILAAQLQSDRPEITALLGRSVRPVTPNRLIQISAEFDLDPVRWAKDMSDPQVTATLDRNQSIATRLGIYGTPATVIGRTIVLGTLPEDQIAQIITYERQAGDPCSSQARQHL